MLTTDHQTTQQNNKCSKTVKYNIRIDAQLTYIKTQFLKIFKIILYVIMSR